MSKSSFVDPAQASRKLVALLEKRATKNEIYPAPSSLSIEKTVSNFGTNSTFVAASHFFKALFSPTILVMPAAFSNGGLIFAVFGHVLMTMFISYNIRSLIICADYLSKREKFPVLTYDQLAFVSFDRCSGRTKALAKPFSILVNVMSMVTTIDALSIFIIFLARNAASIASYYFPELTFTTRHFIFFTIAPIMFANTIRQLKYLSPFSIVASLILYISCILCFQFYFVYDNPSVWERRQIGDYSIIRFIAMVLFSQSGISFALTLKSSMKKPHQFLGFPGVYCITIILTTMIYIPFGYFGYLHFGDETKASVMLNLPNNQYKGVIVKIMTMVSVFMTIPIAFYVAFNVMWVNFIKHRVNEVNQLFAEYFVRALLVVLLFGIATALPTLGPMIVLKGSLFHSQMEVIYPPILEYVTYYPEKGSGRGHFRLIKAIVISSIGILISLAGTCIGIWDFINGLDELIS